MVIKEQHTKYMSTIFCPPLEHFYIIDHKKTYYSLKKEMLYRILIEFGIPMKLAGLIKMCVNEKCRVWWSRNI
jgi:hypothetical protein